LKVGDHVTAYDPTTGKPTTQTIERVFINHDTDRLNVTLAYSASAATAGAAARTRADATVHGRVARAGQSRQPAGTSTPTGAMREEVIHTTASHPWLTADDGWLRAGQLHLGESVRLLNGGVATVVALHAVPGVGAMWDLSLDATHTFAVGTAQAVVHNCGGAFGTEDTKFSEHITDTHGDAQYQRVQRDYEASKGRLQSTKTYFKGMSNDSAMDAVKEAWGNRSATSDIEGASTIQWQGSSGNMVIEGNYDVASDTVTTAYPVGQQFRIDLNPEWGG
jgi:hypothetical protein